MGLAASVLYPSSMNSRDSNEHRTQNDLAAAAGSNNSNHQKQNPGIKEKKLPQNNSLALPH